VEATLDHTPGKTGFRGVLLVTLCVTLAACATSWHWPWHHKPKPPPQPIHDVTVQSDNAASIFQYWDRNTLQFDLTALSGEGTATVTPVKSVGWPVRIEFLVRPGSVGRLEVTAAQRVVFEVPPQGKNVVMKLAPGAYTPQTQSIILRWSAAGDSGH
jgi:hypothetical protein